MMILSVLLRGFCFLFFRFCCDEELVKSALSCRIKCNQLIAVTFPGKKWTNNAAVTNSGHIHFISIDS